jgi:hypothetical protein
VEEHAWPLLLSANSKTIPVVAIIHDFSGQSQFLHIPEASSLTYKGLRFVGSQTQPRGKGLRLAGEKKHIVRGHLNVLLNFIQHNSNAVNRFDAK